MFAFRDQIDLPKLREVTVGSLLGLSGHGVGLTGWRDDETLDKGEIGTAGCGNVSVSSMYAVGFDIS